jgi:hypothetical protein
MENVRVVVDLGDPCPFCGYETVVFEREDDFGWFEERRECTRGCNEVVVAGAAKRRARRIA